MSPDSESIAPGSPAYETDRAVAEYLLFHYGTHAEILPYAGGPVDALEYPLRCAQRLLAIHPEPARALDLGCAVGRASFELARVATEVVGVDVSRRFVATCEALKASGELPYDRTEEGWLATPSVAQVAPDIDRSRVEFKLGDACAPSADWGTFDALLLANLIDRLPDPAACLAALPGLVRPGGTMLITSPYTWLADFTDPSSWLGGFVAGNKPGSPDDPSAVRTFDTLKAALDPTFELLSVDDMPFLIREHARKFQWSVAQASVWRRRG